MSKNNNSTIKVDREEDFVRIYKHVEFGSKVEVFGKEAVVTGFEPSIDGMDAKVVYREGGFDYINRDDLESEMDKVIKLRELKEIEGDDDVLSECCGAILTVQGLCSDCLEHA